MARFVAANRLRFAIQTWGPTSGDAPLALCLHGFPDHAMTWRHLAPDLAAAGYRVVAPWMRGYAPTEVPEAGGGRTSRCDPDTLAADANSLHRALDGDERALIVGHDWGAIAAYRATAAAPERWRTAVTLAVPPEPALRGSNRDIAQARRSWYALALSLPGGAALLRRDSFALVERLWREWSPGYEPRAEDLEPVVASLSGPGSAEAATAYYRAIRRWLLAGFPGPGRNLPRVATLYLHGQEDGCIGARYAERAEPLLPAGSRVEILDDAGHFLHLERPDLVADRVLEFAGRPGSPE